jgi:hypothetical protein
VTSDIGTSQVNNSRHQASRHQTYNTRLTTCLNIATNGKYSDYSPSHTMIGQWKVSRRQSKPQSTQHHGMLCPTCFRIVPYVPFITRTNYSSLPGAENTGNCLRVEIGENAERVSMVEVAKGAGSRDVGHGNDQSCRNNHRGCQNRRR